MTRIQGFGPQRAWKSYLWMCLWGCFWRLAFESADWARRQPCKCWWAQSNSQGLREDQRQRKRLTLLRLAISPPLVLDTGTLCSWAFERTLGSCIHVPLSSYKLLAGAATVPFEDWDKSVPHNLSLYVCVPYCFCFSEERRLKIWEEILYYWLSRLFLSISFSFLSISSIFGCCFSKTWQTVHHSSKGAES